jgi:hypothetical protein
VVSRRREDNRSIGRRGPTRQPKRRILVVCEGRETEPGYLRAFQRAARNPCVEVKIADKTGAPRTLVDAAIRLRRAADEEARRQRDENLRWDEVWSVFDVDEHATLDEAKLLAQREGIEVAVSNPSFELWALLHYEDQRAHIDRKKLRARLTRYQPSYDKSLDFARMHPGYGDALRRAAVLVAEADRHGMPGRNPSTGVHRLTQSILAR